MLLHCAKKFTSEIVLFEDALPSALEGRGIPFRRLGDEERASAFAHEHEPVGEYGLVFEGEVVASGGFATHYNPPSPISTWRSRPRIGAAASARTSSRS